jgi:hypothetical protein
MGTYLQGCVLACDLNHKGNSRYESCEMSEGVCMRKKYRFLVGAECSSMQKICSIHLQRERNMHSRTLIVKNVH